MAKARVKGKRLNGFAEINHDAAGIDVGTPDRRCHSVPGPTVSPCYRLPDAADQSVFKKAISALRSSSDSANPNGWPFTA